MRINAIALTSCLLCVVFVGWGANCAIVKNDFPIPKSELTETREVYTVVINEIFADSHSKALAISTRATYLNNPEFLKKTTFDERLQSRKQSYESVDLETLRSFQQKFDEPSKLDSELNLDLVRPYATQDEDELDKVKDAKLFKYFYDRHPDAEGMIRLSRVGFNPAVTQAFVEIEFVYCPLCGFGEYVLLEKDAGVWKIRKRFSGWVS